MKEKRRKKIENENFNLIHEETKKSILAIIFFGLAVIFILAAFKEAGPAGQVIYQFFNYLVGIGYFLLPLILIVAAGAILFSKRKKTILPVAIGSLIFILAALGMVDIIQPSKGGIVGSILGYLKYPFGSIASFIINLILLIIAIVVILNFPITALLSLLKKKPPVSHPDFSYQDNSDTEDEEVIDVKKDDSEPKVSKPEPEEYVNLPKEKSASKNIPVAKPRKISSNYVFPPLDLLQSNSEKPTTGDLKANANVIKRTLENFGIPVEMGEINVGPKVTRYTLKPAEGIKLSRITVLSQDLALALAAHPIRIEAPIPGKSLVGIEVPNKAAALVRLGNLLKDEKFQKSSYLTFPLGRDVSGNLVLADIEKMPHLLIAGSTGSGKSVAIHSLIISLLYKNSPDTLKMILIDPKRVELSIYNGIPHLIGPVIIDNKKSLAAFKWAINEMERRYEILLSSGHRDIKSYNEDSHSEPMPYVIIIVDELADLMSSYGREVEGFVVRLAQMSRAVGIHLILSTQRPSVEIITGLIKANITSRIALQVASQVDSRTILDTAGAEKLLGSGDMLYISSEISKPKRIQGAYLSEEEIKRVAEFVEKENRDLVTEEMSFDADNNQEAQNSGDIFDNFEDEEDKDELYIEALKTVLASNKASASLLQRRLQIGYARAARILDLMVEDGLIEDGIGAKPRNINKEKIEEYLSFH